MPDVAKLGIEVESRQVKQAAGDLNRLENESKQAASSVDKLGNQTGKTNQQTGKLSRSVAGMVAKYAGIGAAVAGITKLAKASLDSAAAIEVQETNFGVLLGDIREGEQFFQRLQEFSAATPLAIDSLSGAAEKLLSFGVEAENVTDTLQTLGDASLGNAQKLESLSRAYGRVQARGRASMEEVNMAMEAGVPIIAELADEMGVAESAVFDMVSAGKVGAEEFNAAFESMTGEGGQFNDGMETLSETFNGKLSTAMDNIKILGGELFEPAIDRAKVLLDGIIDVTQQLRRVSRSPEERREARQEELTTSIADQIRFAESYSEVESNLASFSEEMFEAAQATENFEAAAQQAQKAQNLEDRIRMLKEQASEAAGPIDDVREAISGLFDRELVTGNDEWYFNFTEENRKNRITTLLDNLSIDGRDLLSESSAQGLAEDGETAILDWLDKQAEHLGGKRDEIAEIEDELAQILSGEGITDQGTGAEPSGPSDAIGAEPSGPSDAIIDLIDKRTQAYNDYQDAVEQVNILAESGFLDQEEQAKRLIGVNEDYAQSLAGLGRLALELNDNLGMKELDQALERILRLQREIDAANKEGLGGSGGESLTEGYSTEGDADQSSRTSQIEEETDAVNRLAEALGWAADDGQRLEDSIERIGVAFQDAMVTGISDSFIALGEAFATGATSGDALQATLEDTFQQILNQLPVMFTAAALQAAIAGQWWLAAGLLGGALATGFGAGIANTAESEPEGRAQGGSVHRGTPYIVGESGPELMVPNSSGRVMPNNMVGGGQTNVTVNNYSGAQVETRERDKNGAREVELVIGRAVEKQVAEGRLDGAMSQRYGVRRRGR